MKKFSIKFFTFFIAANTLVFVYFLFIKPQMIGDLGKLGKIVFQKSAIDSIPTPSKVWVKDVVANIKTMSSNTIFTLGDSFSGQCGFGYQHYIGKHYNNEVGNIQRKNDYAEQYFLNLLNSNIIPQNTTIIVESVERSAIERLLGLNWEGIIVDEPVEISTEVPHKKEKNGFRTWNIEEIPSWLRMRCFNYDCPVVTFSLSKKCFSNKKYGDKLFVYKNDLNFVHQTDENFKAALNNLQKLKNLADEKGVNFIYVIASDKYDLYSKYIVDNPHPANKTLDYFSALDTTWFLNTKSLLQPFVDNNLLDVYYLHDTHWSPIAAEIVGNQLVKMIERGREGEREYLLSRKSR